MTYNLFLFILRVLRLNIQNSRLIKKQTRKVAVSLGMDRYLDDINLTNEVTSYN